MNRTVHLRTVSTSALMLAFVSSAAVAQQALPSIDVGAARTTVRAPARRVVERPAPARPTAVVAAPSTSAPGFSPEKKALPVYRDPTGQTFTTVKRETFTTTSLQTISDLMQYSPGVSFKQGNGPRDMTISIRGSAGRVAGAMRNVVLLEDGFMMTQPDGFSRADSTDPHAYAGVDVYRGPSSALFGNYANGGAVNFRTRSGAEINGVETGHDAGSFGYLNNYVAAGKKIGNLDVAIFASDVRGSLAMTNSRYDTQTVNLKASYQLTPSDLLTFKWVHNQLLTEVPNRLSYNQFLLNPYQRGCYGVSTPNNVLNSLCGQTSVFLNGAFGATARVTAEQTGWHRNDRRDVLGLRWEHSFDPNTVWSTSVLWDTKNFYQPIDTPVGYADAPSYDFRSNVTHNGDLMGHDLRSYVGVWYNRMRFTSYSKNLAPFGFGDLQPLLTNKQEIMHSNLGANFREELALSPTVTGVIGLATEFSRVAAISSSVSYPSGALTQVPANRAFWNFAPEASLTWQPTREWRLYARASSGYGTPQYGFLFVNQQGLDGNNTDLKPQRNTGFDAGFTWTPYDRLSVTLNGFHEWYENEMLTQTPGAGRRNYTFNAPRSVHRGAEFVASWRPIDGWSVLANYTYNNQIFQNFTEQRGPTSFFNRAGYKIPGVAPHELTARLAYDHPAGTFKGLGAFIEYIYKSSYYVDNGNQLTLPSYGLVNINAHYERDIENSWLKKFSAYVEVRNVFDRTYVSGASIIANSLTAGFQNPGVVLAQNATGSMYAGLPRAIQGGVKFNF